MSAKKKPEERAKRVGLSLPSNAWSYVEWKTGRGKFSNTVADAIERKMLADKDYAAYLQENHPKEYAEYLQALANLKSQKKISP